MNTSTKNGSGLGYVLISSGSLIDKVNDGFFTSIYVPSFVYTIFMMLMCCPGNLLVFYIYFVRWRKTTSRVFIIALALFDLTNGFVTTPTELAFMWNIFRWKNAPVCKFSRFLTFMMNNASSFTLLGIAIDRYMRICRPLHPSMTTKTAKIWVFVSCFVAVFFAWPALVIYGIQTINYPIPKISVIAVGSTCLIEDYFFSTNYPLIFTIVILSGNIIIDVVLITLYTLIAIQVVRRGSFDRERDSSIRKKLRKASVSTTTTDDGIIDDAKSNNEIKGSSMLGRFSKKFHGSLKENDNSQKDGKLKTQQSPSTKRSNFRRQRSLSIQSEEARRVRMIKTTVMLFLVTLLFMVSFIPYCVIVIYRYVNPMYYFTLSSTGKGVYQFFLRSYLLSMSLNPVIYSFMSEQFRQECKYGLKKLAFWKKNN